MISKRQFINTLAAGAAVAAAPLAWSQASDFPRRPLKLLVGFPAGSPGDVLGRAFARELEVQLGQSVVVDNRPGATGLIAMDALTQAPADGHTLMLLVSTTTTALHFARKPLDMDKRFTPIGHFLGTRIVLVVNPKAVDVHNLDQFVAYARRNPGVHYTGSGHGGLGHLGMELFAQRSGLKLSFVAYKGMGAALEDVLAARVPVMVLDANAALPHVRAGTLRAIVAVSTQRAPAFPELPTALEQGVDSLQIDGMLGIVAPPKTPAPVVDRLRTALREASGSESFLAAAKAAGNARVYMDAPEYAEWIRRDFERWGQVIQTAGLLNAPGN
ncbi:tripartite tricarboxylate transporter substrate binding protein [uncultured Hydrogenophaga sp.]|uniref:Bug family tripartite tricarboxylate transporter substrate binding protein n=1 Tax=uncultured Hydrogenophaga sp. TaxID=199683 RepID=UPI0025880510|nr:tripartite tricarboxylate transporter substrate binding protein [uncultured Hydrogenophaga sp.]